MSKLCFGSYTQALKKYSTGTNETIVNDLLNGIKENTSIDKGGVSRLFNCKEKLTNDFIEKSQTNKVIDTIEQYFEDYIIPNLIKQSLWNLIQNFQRLINGDETIPYETKVDLISNINNLAKFLSKTFLYAVVQNNIFDNPLDNLGDIETIKQPKFEQTINSTYFNNVFIEVKQDKDLGLLNNNHIKTFHLDIENNKFSFKTFNKFLVNNIGRYMYSRMQLDEFIINGEQETIAREAINLLKNKGYALNQLDDELGNIVIYLFLENILKAPKLYTNIECLDSVINKAGVHLLQLNSEKESFQIVFSKSHITNSLAKSINNAFNDLGLLKNSTDKPYKFLETTILNQNFDEITSKNLKNIIMPQKRDKEVIVDNAYGLLIGYSIDIERNVPNDIFRENVKKQMIEDLQGNISYIVSKINELGMQNSSFYIYLLPFDDANSDKNTIMKSLVGGE